MSDLSALNDEQRQAVVHGPGPLLVISAAGSGKTRVLVHRAAHLVDQGALAHRVMLCTFTKKAATEMAERVTALAPEAMNMRVGTMHSLLFRVLRDEGYPFVELRDDSDTQIRDHILDEYGQKRLLKDILGHDADADLADVMAQIGLWKNELATHEDAEAIDPFTAEVWREYEDRKAQEKRIDYDDMIVAAVRLFEEQPALIHRHRPDWLLVDEAQDTSKAQWRALKLLTGEPVRVNACQTDARTPEARAALADVVQAAAVRLGAGPRNLTCVADWRQAIYSWRGARPEFILDFEERFPGATVIGLPRNYRSVPEVVTAANALIRHAGRQLDDMIGVRGPNGRIEVAYTIAEDTDVEAIAVASEIEAQIEEGGRKPSEFAVLYRVNAYSRAFEEALAELQIPYTVVGSKGFFGRKEVTDVLAYLQLVADPSDEESLRRIANKPTRYLGKKFCDAVVAASRRQKTTLRAVLSTAGSRLSLRQRSAAERFGYDLDDLAGFVGKGHPPSELIAHVRQHIGYDRWLKREEGSGGADEDRLETLNQLERVAERFNSLAEFLRFVERQRSQSQSDRPGDRVQLMSIHRSKGLEWPVVFAVGWSEELLPHRRCMDPVSLEEERRLGYVAITRARDELHVSSVRDWQGVPLAPSRFVYEAELAPSPAVLVPAGVTL